VESGVYYGWAGLSPSKATHQHPPHKGSTAKYKHMALHLYHSLVKIASGDGISSEEEKEAWARDKGAVYPMVMSIGWNPFYKNTVRSVEVHIMHHFETDFYGSHMNLVILGFIRPELDYVSKEKLIEDIKTDIDVAGRSLARKPYAKYREDKYLLDFQDKDDVAK
jgi:riboflavin kinase